MTAVLITGMSATGKTTLLGELERRGHAVVDTDTGGWIEPVRLADGTDEPMWREDRMSTLLNEHAGGTLFVAGCVANQGRFYRRFRAVVLLSVPRDVLVERLATRSGNEFGRSGEERARILADLESVEPLLRRGSTVEIDTRRPLAQVADELERLAGVTPRRPAP
ncbi:MAG TPA: AAA family ATPase [Gaiellales bacterium]|nr:AAA family ATPase [Gaiellales bacterium]